MRRARSRPAWRARSATTRRRRACGGSARRSTGRKPRLSRYPKTPMARGAAQARRKAAKTQTPRKAPARRQTPSYEQTMFFPRLRRQAKWVFVLLAFVFAAGFVFFGVGSGSTGIGDLLKGNFNLFGGGGSTQSSGVKKALKRTDAHPQEAAAWLALATAYQTDGKLDQANRARERYLKLKPNDAGVLQQVA